MPRLALLLLLVLAGVAPAWAVPAPTGNHADIIINAGSTSGSGTMTATTGNLIVCTYRVDTSSPAGSVGSISDSAGNTYTSATGQLLEGNYNRSSQVYYANNITGGSPLTITVNTLLSPGGFAICSEFSGVATASPLDVHADGTMPINPGTGTDAVTSGAATTTTSGELIYTSFVGFGGTGSASQAVGTGFTRVHISPGGAGGTGAGTLDSAYKVQSSSGSTAGTWTLGSSDSSTVASAQMATFKATGAAPPPGAATLPLLGVGR